MNFLDITQRVARLSGAADSRSVTTTQGASGHVGLIAELVREAWLEIQNEYRAWRFLVVDFPETTVLEAGLNTFTAASLNLANWSEWIPGNYRGTVPITGWPAAADGEPEDRGREAQLVPADYRQFRQSYQYGSSVTQDQTGQPRVLSIDNQDRLVVWPTPDRDYRLSGTFRRSAQELLADDDVPIIAPEFHNTIVWAATLLLHRADESDQTVLLTTRQDMEKRKAALRRRYIPAPSVSFTPLGSGRSGYVGASSRPNPNFAD